VPLRRSPRRPPDERFDVVILAVQPPQIEDAARTALPALADGGVCVVLPNGLCEPRVARIVGAERVIGAIVAWGASMPSPGRYERTAAGGFTIGRLGGSARRQCRRVAALLEAVGPTVVHRQPAAARAGASSRSTARSRRSARSPASAWGRWCGSAATAAWRSRS
jgi:2-dehydropantoate 2-reductase